MKAAVRTSADDNSQEVMRRAEALGLGKYSCRYPESARFSLGTKSQDIVFGRLLIPAAKRICQVFHRYMPARAIYITILVLAGIIGLGLELNWRFFGQM
jgi:hypothetical protein